MFQLMKVGLIKNSVMKNLANIGAFFLLITILSCSQSKTLSDSKYFEFRESAVIQCQGYGAFSSDSILLNLRSLPLDKKGKLQDESVSYAIKNMTSGQVDSLETYGSLLIKVQRNAIQINISSYGYQSIQLHIKDEVLQEYLSLDFILAEGEGLKDILLFY